MQSGVKTPAYAISSLRDFFEWTHASITRDDYFLSVADVDAILCGIDLAALQVVERGRLLHTALERADVAGEGDGVRGDNLVSHVGLGDVRLAELDGLLGPRCSRR